MDVMEPIPHVIAVEVIGVYVVRLRFDDGLVRDVDLGSRLVGPALEPLRNPEYFARVSIDPVTKTIAWPNGVDFDSAVLHGDFEPERIV